MQTFLDNFQTGIGDACRRFGVKRLEAFGSVLRSDFSERSDVDFVVEFDRSQPDAFEQYFGLKEELEALLERKVELLRELHSRG